MVSRSRTSMILRSLGGVERHLEPVLREIALRRRMVIRRVGAVADEIERAAQLHLVRRLRLGRRRDTRGEGRNSSDDEQALDHFVSGRRRSASGGMKRLSKIFPSFGFTRTFSPSLTISMFICMRFGS